MAEPTLQEIDLQTAQAMLGAAESIAATLETPGWKVLVEAFRQVSQAAHDELLTCDPTDAREVMRLQNRANRYYDLESMVTELLQQAANIAELEQEQE